MPASADHFVPGRETIRPVASGDEHPLQIATPAYAFLLTHDEASIIPPAHTDRKHQQDGSGLQAVNGTLIATYDRCSMTLDLVAPFVGCSRLLTSKRPSLVLTFSAILVSWWSTDYQMPR